MLTSRIRERERDLMAIATMDFPPRLTINHSIIWMVMIGFIDLTKRICKPESSLYNIYRPFLFLLPKLDLIHLICSLSHRQLIIDSKVER